MKNMHVVRIASAATLLLFAFMIAGSFAGPADMMAKDLWKAMDTAGKSTSLKSGSSSWMDMSKKGVDLFDKYKPLSDMDKQADPNYNPPGMPQVPTSCDEAKKDGCKSCYQDAYGRLYKLRMNFERLRALKLTTESFTKSAIAFGDSVSGVHGVAGLGWQAEKAKIEASYKNFEKAYKSKHQELVERLKGVMQDIDKCESQYYGEKDWYNRFGYMYYSFMEDRYKW